MSEVGCFKKVVFVCRVRKEQCSRMHAKCDFYEHEYNPFFSVKCLHEKSGFCESSEAQKALNMKGRNDGR